ncbi:unnamed protein product [Owenia fusiformis]|uniref:Methyltransferase domain-containing protein n=1 Tax=Owenia fusiformis TaxID=6347 RepID=A0A8S4N1I6_OWEFU|nr:unnamed protein product [Owenia fusiformis]
MMDIIYNRTMKKRWHMYEERCKQTVLLCFIVATIIYLFTLANKEPGKPEKSYNGVIFFKTITEKIPNSAVDKDTALVTEEWFFTWLEKTQVHCDDVIRIGNQQDGGWNMCVSGPYKPQEKCLVYSFGINNDWSFDDDVTSRFSCEVHSFDPSMNMSDHRRSETIYFHSMGLSNKDYVTLEGWPMMSFSSILTELKHEKAIMDMLKMDIEYSEHEVLPDLFAEGVLQNIKQLAFEFHFKPGLSPERYKSFYTTLSKLETQFNFRKYLYHRNEVCSVFSPIKDIKRSGCHELYYINLDYM